MAAADTTRYGELCRLCASKTNLVLNAINIFGNEGAIRQINKKIGTCLPVQIHEADELPKMICENCLYKVELFCDFRDRAVRTENLLIDLYKELNTNQVQDEQHMVKMNVVALDHPDLIMVQPHHQLMAEHSIQNVNKIDLGQLAQRDNMIVEQEIILAHPHSLENISLDHHDLANQDLSNHSLQGPNSLLVDENGGVHAMPNVRFSEANLDLMQQEHQLLTEQYRLQHGVHDMSEAAEQNHLDDAMQITSIKNSEIIIKECIESQIAANTLVQLTATENDVSDSESLQIETDFRNSKSTEKTESSGNLVISTQHDISKEEQKWFYCNMCGDTYGEKEEFQLHYDQHLYINKCTECLAVFTSQDALNSHRKEVHDTRTEDVVKVDSNKESKQKKSPKSNKTNLNEEDSDSEDGNLLDCLDDEEYEDDPDPGPEVADSGGTKRKKWSPKICKECGKSYKTNYKLTEHMRKHTGEKPYKCKSCEKAFRSKIGLAQHEAKHTGQYDYSCSTCGKGFQCKSYLMVHQRVHSDEKPYPCTTCGRNFKTKQSLLDHTNRHLGVKPYMCDICGRGFITKGLCRAHQKVHSGADNRKYSCNVCSKRFVSKSYLQTHYRIHTGEKPFMCEVCGKGFLTRVDLRIHSTMHTGEKSYVCEMCGKAFARRDALRCHRRSHTGERPYSCDQCGQTFTQFSPMAIHKRLHTGERPYVCEVCGKKFVSRSTMVAHSKKHVR